jgi:hypothetical protein
MRPDRLHRFQMTLISDFCLMSIMMRNTIRSQWKKSEADQS